MRMPEVERISRSKGFLDGVSQLRPPERDPPRRDRNAPSEAAVKVLIKSALEPGTPLLTLYKALGLHPAEGKSAVDDLLARGLVKSHRLVRKGRGGQPQVLEVLPEGVADLERRGITPAAKKLPRGGFLHDVYARCIERWVGRQGYTVWFERLLGRKAFDIVYQSSDGELRAIEICLSGSAGWTAQQLIKGAEAPGIREVVAACAGQGFLRAVMREVGKIDQLGLYREKIAGRLLAEYVDCSVE